VDETFKDEHSNFMTI